MQQCFSFLPVSNQLLSPCRTATYCNKAQRNTLSQEPSFLWPSQTVKHLHTYIHTYIYKIFFHVIFLHLLNSRFRDYLFYIHLIVSSATGISQSHLYFWNNIDLTKLVIARNSEMFVYQLPLSNHFPAGNNKQGK